MPKKSVDEFKQAFKAIKKPKMPKAVNSKTKSALEKAVGKDDDDTFVANIKTIGETDRDYLVDLVAYKFAKHFDNDDKRPFWQDKVPKDVMQEALAKIVPDDLDSTLTQKTFEKAIAGKQTSTVAMLFERDPAKAEKFVFDKFLSLTGNGQDEERTSWAIAARNNGVDMAAFEKKLLKQALAGGNEAAATQMGYLLVNVGEDELVDFAKDDPKQFFETALHGLKDTGTDFIKVLSKKSLRDKLKALDPDAWAEFVADTPMLASLAAVEAAVQTKGLTESSDIMDEMFTAVMDKKNMPLGYSGTAFDSNHLIMAGPTDKTNQFRENQKKAGIVDNFPEDPATDCHHLLYITQQMMEMYPGPKPEIHNVSCPDMLMTKPLSSIPGRGTLDRGFTGNVFDESGKPTGRVLFTGDDQGQKSHTWLSVKVAGSTKEEFYDPVIGTKGADVKGAVEMELTWVIPKRLARGNTGRYAVQDKKLKPASNSMGFSTGYYLTDNPAKYLSKDEKKQAGLE
jgi:hypothetical protein